VETLRQDLIFALRLLRRDGAYTVTVVLTLAICLGANAAIFTVVRSVLFRPLPYPESHRLVVTYDSFAGAGVERAGTSVPNYMDRAALTHTFDSVALYRPRGLDAGDAGTVERLAAQQVTPSFFTVLRATPARGRFFSEAESQDGQGNVVVISHDYWTGKLGGREDVIGQDLRLNGRPYRIVGVTAQRFVFLDPEVKVWIPSTFTAEQKAEDARYSQDHDAIARLAQGASLQQAQTQADALTAANLERAGSLKPTLLNARYRTVVVPLEADVVRNVRSALRLLWGAALFVLLIAAVNVTNLALVRTGGRLKEIATRHAIGAGRTRVLRQLLTETTLLTALGGALGLVLASWALTGLSWIGLDDLPRGHEIRLDTTVVLFTIGLAAALGIVIGLAPAIQLSGLNLNVVLREDGRTATASRGSRLTRRTLVVAQVALAFVLLVGAGLLLSSFERLLAVNPGFRPAHVLTGRVNPPPARYADDAALRTFAVRAVQRVRALPGVEAAGAASELPFTDDSSSSVIMAEGYQMAPGESVLSPAQLRATPGYFETMNIALRRGRFFTDADTAEAPRVVIVDDTLARKFWPDRDPIGRRMYVPSRPEDIAAPGPNVTWLQVVGVVDTVKQEGLVEGEGARVGAYYFAYAQDPSGSLGLAIRTAGDPASMISAARQALNEIDPQLSFFDVRTMTERIERSLDHRRTPMMLAVGFAAIALLLATIGIYGVLAYQVAQRRREIGIRMALGSDTGGIFRLVLSEGAVLVGAGLLGGLVGAIVLRGAIATELYEVSALDPRVLAAVIATLALTSTIACLGPARRAAKVSPLVALSNQ
jgi:predicted permease